MAYEMSSKQPVLFFDGDCPLCNRVVRFILDHEYGERMLFSSLSHESTKQWVAQHENFQMPDDSVYFFDGARLHSKSTAVLRIIPFLRWYCRFLYVGWLFPRGFRDKIYDEVAKRRRSVMKECFVDPRLAKRLLQS